MADLTVQYTPGITSGPDSSPFICHRICYRADGEGEYCCQDDDSVSVAGTPKTFIIDLDASPGCDVAPGPDPQSCITVGYNGYVQACCELEDSIDGRVAWTAGFTPDPDCVNKLVCCQTPRGLLGSYLTISNPGSGYDDTLSPINAIVVRNPSDSVSPGGANDAIISVTIAGGIITGLSTTAQGLYSINPLIIIPSPTLGGPTQATVVSNVPCVGLPGVDLAGIEDCNGNVHGDAFGSEFVPLLGECKSFCFPKSKPFIYHQFVLTGPNTTNFNYTQQGCCDCTTCGNYTVVTDSLLDTVILGYYRCTNNSVESAYIETVPLSGSGSHTINCAVPGSITCPTDPNAIASITRTGDCAECTPD